jgi:hypothetical protein
VNLSALKSAIDYQVQQGHGQCEIKVLIANGALLTPLKLKKDMGEQEIIPENPAPAPLFILEA